MAGTQAPKQAIPEEEGAASGKWEGAWGGEPLWVGEVEGAWEVPE